ncbi:MAG: hypothetical protein JXL84_02445 [Deltaproteobacteria bacterium]|nr:hypothetical protein [Deltaproteobacteria bacterium]
MVEGSLKQDYVDMNRVAYAVLVACLAAEALLFVLDIFLNVAQFWYFEKFGQLSNVALEKSFGTWFSVVQNFAVALTALILSIGYKSILGQPKRSMGWFLVSAFFAYVSLDDDLMLHERVGGTVGPLLFGKGPGGAVPLPTYEWIFLFGPFFAAFGIFFLVFVWKELRDSRKRTIFVSGLFLWAVAQLLDAWEGTRSPYDWLLRSWGLKEMVVRHSFMLVEEVFEMLGSTFFLYLFLGHVGFLYSERRIVLGTPANRAMPGS